MLTQEDSFGLGRFRTIRTRTRPHSWDKESRNTTPQQRGYWEHWGKQGEAGTSLLYSSSGKQPTSALGEQRSEVPPVLHESGGWGGERCGRWEVRLGVRGEKTPPPPGAPNPSLSRFGISLSKGRKHVSVQVMRMHWKRDSEAGLQCERKEGKIKTLTLSTALCKYFNNFLFRLTLTQAFWRCFKIYSGKNAAAYLKIFTNTYRFIVRLF